MNFPLVSSFIAIFFTQLIKYPIAYLSNRKKAKLSVITSTGGMPSSHSAAVSSLITSLILDYGFSSPLVAISTVFGVIIMFDSMGVRRQSGEQGIVLDILARHHIAEIEDIRLHHNESTNPLITNFDVNNYDRMIINRYLGHKPSEVVVGVLTGMLVALIMRLFIGN